MNGRTLNTIVGLGALSGLRSMAGLTTLAFVDGGASRGVMALLAAGEMIADKTPFVGNRIDPLPLTGRAATGALAGGLLGSRHRENVLLSAAIGAASAVVAAHVAYQTRTRLPLSPVAGGLLEDTLVLAVGRRLAETLKADL